MVTFETLRWKNLLSTGNNWTEVDLNGQVNTLVMGENGSGKSTILDAITFVLFGKPFRKINKPQLVNSINNGDCLVEIKFSVGTKHYEVVRGIKPSVFTISCNGNEIPSPASAKDYQDILENQILGFSYKSFCQVVILGSSTFVPFMQLPAAQRREIIEDLLDISIFGQMNDALKSRVSEHKEEVSDVKSGISLKDQYIDLQTKTLDSIKQSNDTEVDALKEKISEHTETIDSGETTLESLNCRIDTLSIDENYAQLDSNTKSLDKAKTIRSKLEGKVAGYNKQLAFLHDQDDCPTCEQTISESFKESATKTKTDERDEHQKHLDDLSHRITQFRDKIGQGETIRDQIADVTTQINSVNADLNATHRIIESLNEQIAKVGSQKDTADIEAGIAEAKEALVELEAQKAELAERAEVYKVVAGLLKDSGIKTLIVKQYLPIINQLVNQYLAKLDFFVKFHLDENFDERILSRHRDDFSYASFSEGEKSRIDLALLLTWRAVARMKNSCATNLLILDEVFDSSLDDGGLAEVTKILYNLGEDQNVMVISHKGDQIADKFKSTLRFEKVRGFSKIV